ncbi:MAG: hypothetical protein AB8G17_03275 [Gammaproteobacteria bacterium]
MNVTYFELMPDLQFRIMGELAGILNREDRCQVSCESFYGEARPLFMDDKIYALVGYELIQGYVSGGNVYEKHRVDALPLIVQ